MGDVNDIVEKERLPVRVREVAQQLRFPSYSLSFLEKEFKRIIDIGLINKKGIIGIPDDISCSYVGLATYQQKSGSNSQRNVNHFIIPTARSHSLEVELCGVRGNESFSSDGSMLLLTGAQIRLEGGLLWMIDPYHPERARSVFSYSPGIDFEWINIHYPANCVAVGAQFSELANAPESSIAWEYNYFAHGFPLVIGLATEFKRTVL